MKEPFRIIGREEYPEVPSFGGSSFGGCYWATYRKHTDPLPITEELNQIFDMGNEVHHEDEVLNMDAKRGVSCEEYIKALHESEKFAISGFHDYIKMDFRGLYLEDLKSGKFGSFYFFLKEGMKRDYIIQLSTYAYLYYIKNGVYIKKGVITKIDKENTRNRLSLETDLMPREEIAEFLLNFPVIHAILGELRKVDFWDVCFEQIGLLDPKYKNGNKKSPWVCMNCQYSKTCELYDYIDREGLVPL